MRTANQLPIGTNLKCDKDLFLRYRSKPTIKVAKDETVLINRIVEYRMGGYAYHCLVMSNEAFKKPRTENISVEEMEDFSKLNY